MPAIPEMARWESEMGNPWGLLVMGEVPGQWETLSQTEGKRSMRNGMRLCSDFPVRSTNMHP